MPETALTNRRRKNSGYSLVMLIFMVATAMIVLSAAVPNILTEGRRGREDEMIWRGQQYERAIGLYFRKFGKYPTKIDDLTKQTNGVRFLRQAYKDPMNTEDGSWRFIYVGPSGQLIGSVHSQSLLQSVLGGGGAGLAGGPGFGAGLQPPPPAGAGGTGTGTPGSDPGSQAGSQFGPQAGSQFGPQAGQQPGQQPGQQSGIGQPSTDSFGPTSMSSSSQPGQGQIIGGNIIGVGSKIKKPSIRTYLGSTSYDQWEFVFNPTTQVSIPGQGAPANLIPGQGPQQQQQQQQQQNPQAPPASVPLSTQPVN